MSVSVCMKQFVFFSCIKAKEDDFCFFSSRHVYYLSVRFLFLIHKVSVNEFEGFYYFESIIITPIEDVFISQYTRIQYQIFATYTIDDQGYFKTFLIFIIEYIKEIRFQINILGILFHQTRNCILLLQ
jgi:hypothetical protein